MSEAKYIDYQRNIKMRHVKEIERFLEECKDEARFLPEVVLSINKPENVTIYKFTHKSFNAISATAKGVIDNIDYFVLEVDGIALSRIDGNHRLEAGKDKNIQVPFSIILWNLDDSSIENLINPELLLNNTESEAFYFIFLITLRKNWNLKRIIRG